MRSHGGGVCAALALVLGSSCQGGGAESETEGGASDPSITTVGAETAGSTGEELPPLCGGLDVSLVLDPKAPIFDEASRAALLEFFDGLVADTRARVRVHATPGTEALVVTDCSESPIVVWGEGGVVDPDAHAVLQCMLDRAADFKGVDGYNLLGGLMHPVLHLEDWPPPDRDDITGLAMLLSAAEDQPVGATNIYNRPGMAAEAYTRIVGGGDRRRVEGFTFGQSADRLETFSVTLGALSHHFDHGAQAGGLPAALAEWAPRAVAACEAQDEPLPVSRAPGCARLDILFVIDGSGSMTEEQAALKDEDGGVSVFGAFAQALVEHLADVEDFHVGVVSNRMGATALHTHRDQPDGDMSVDCGLPPGQPWLVGPSDTLVEDFACLASTYTDTALEYTAANAALALVDEQNAGFVRDDSLVFVVILTDEDTWEEQPTRMQTRATFLEAVGGDPDRLLVLGIGGDQGVYEDPAGVCDGVYGEAAPAARITSIVYSLRERGIMKDICEGSLAETFNSILQTITVVCEGES